MSRTQLRDWSELAEEQGWRTLTKPGGKWVFYPPAGTVPPDLRVLNITEPLNESNRSYDNIRALLKRAGLKFSEDKPPLETSRAMQPIPKSVSSAPPLPVPSPPNLFAQAREKISAAIDLLSEIEQIIGKVEADSQQLQKLRELLKGI